MIAPDPSPRTDLPWLRRLHRPAPEPPPQPPPQPQRKIDTTRHRSPRPAPKPAPASRIDVVHHGRTAERPAGTGLLDLSGGAPSAAGPPVPASPGPAPPSAPGPDVRRVRTGEPPRLLTHAHPTVRLTRLQSGVGQLRIELVASAAVGDVRLGTAVELTDRRSSVVLEGGRSDTWPPARPVVRLVRGQYAALLVDLRQVRALRRLAVFGVAGSGPLAWGGTLVVTTHAGARVEAPLDLGDDGREDGREPTGAAVLLTLHLLDGEGVLRAEADPLGGSVRDLCLAYGYDRITWADDRTPAG